MSCGNKYCQSGVQSVLNPAFPFASIWSVENEEQKRSDENENFQSHEVKIYYGAIDLQNDFVTSFEDLNLHFNIMEGVNYLLFSQPILVQQYLPLILNRKYDDIVIHAEHGKGKTSSAVIAVLNCLAESPNNETKAVIICPTYESAKKLVEIGEKLAKYAPKLSFCLLKRKQKDHKNVDLVKRIIVGTPEKVNHVVQKSLININNVKVMVIDEVDIMLTNQGHLNSLSDVFRLFPKSSQIIILNSLTEDEFKNGFKNIKSWTERPCPLVIKFLSSVSCTNSTANQIFVSCDDQGKRKLLEKIIFERYMKQMIVVCQSVGTVKELTKSLRSKELSVDSWYGKLAQTKKEAIMQAFKNNKTRILVSTPSNADMFQHDVPTIICHDQFKHKDEFELNLQEYKKFSDNLTKSPYSLLVNFIDERDKPYLGKQITDMRIIDEAELTTKLIRMRGHFSRD